MPPWSTRGPPAPIRLCVRAPVCLCVCLPFFCVHSWARGSECVVHLHPGPLSLYARSCPPDLCVSACLHPECPLGRFLQTVQYIATLRKQYRGEDGAGAGARVGINRAMGVGDTAPRGSPHTSTYSTTHATVGGGGGWRAEGWRRRWCEQHGGKRRQTSKCRRRGEPVTLLQRSSRERMGGGGLCGRGGGGGEGGRHRAQINDKQEHQRGEGMVGRGMGGRDASKGWLRRSAARARSTASGCRPVPGNTS